MGTQLPLPQNRAEPLNFRPMSKHALALAVSYNSTLSLYVTETTSVARAILGAEFIHKPAYSRKMDNITRNYDTYW